MTSSELRQKFLEFFEKKGHKVLPSASLVPDETDPSVLFNTAGMQQFKRYYSEPEAAPSARISTIQKCVRTGDIDEVGDNTHLTLFEMMGNFSFGYRSGSVIPVKTGILRDKIPEQVRDDGDKSPYFKKEAIAWAWEFLTETLQFDKDRIHATYFRGEKGVAEDTESLEILKSIDGLGKVEPQGFLDNFWSLGTENSPGGPTVEFYIDGIEVWNLVFNEYVMKSGKFEPSDVKGVDTGMGFERLLAVIEDKNNVYETELFESIIQKLDTMCHSEAQAEESQEILRSAQDDKEKNLRIIADHIKAAVFAINDGILPSNKDAGYVVRRLIRRAIVKAREIDIEDNFTVKIAEEVFKIYDGIYFSCHSEAQAEESQRSFADAQDDKCEMILAELEKEEVKFRKTLKDGLRVLSLIKNITAKDLFNLYQSYGLPIEISIEEAKSRDIKIDDETVEQFNSLMSKHQDLSRTASAGLFKGGLVESGEMTTKYHTATHLLLAALRQLVSPDIYQRGSNITAERLRLDFNYDQKLTPEQIKSLEDLVNEKISEDLPVEMKEMDLNEAKKSGAMGIFDSKYGDKVKVYSVDSFSREICGGPHVTHTGILGHFKITKEESSSSGVRRIKAVLE
ncbi:MAG: alanine--tRNA ligase-related protein [bacterium]|nr:alanine--tRNA ligase-related protein [bacterium]